MGIREKLVSFLGRKPSQYKYQRYQIIINPKLQFTVVGFFVAFFLVTFAIFYFLNLYIFAEIQNDPGLPEYLIPKIQEIYIFSERVISVTYLLVLMIIVAGGFLLSHKIAGPIYRLKKHLDMLNSGETTDNVRFRDHDFFMEVQDSFNLFLDKWRNK